MIVSPKRINKNFTVRRVCNKTQTNSNDVAEDSVAAYSCPHNQMFLLNQDILKYLLNYSFLLQVGRNIASTIIFPLVKQKNVYSKFGLMVIKCCISAIS